MYNHSMSENGSHLEAARKTPRERFLVVAERRTREILHKIHLLGNCANRSAYEYREEEVERIFSAIQEELDAAKVRFAQRKQIDFSLRPSE